MRIYKKLLILFLCLVLCPMLIVGIWSYRTGRATLKKEIIAKLEGMAEYKAKEIEAYFRERQYDVLSIQPSPFIKENITMVSWFVEDKGNPEYIAAAARLDSRLKVYDQAYGYHDIALINPEGRVVYSLNKSHFTHKTCILLYEPLKAVFEKGREGISFSDVYRDEMNPDQFLITITAPVHDSKGTFLGEIAFDIDMKILYELIQNNPGLGRTGETLIGKQVADGALYLSPLRYNPDAALKMTVKPGDEFGISMLRALEGHTGSGVSIDYRGEQVIAVWRHISSLGWGMVVKVDVWDAFGPVAAMRNKEVILLIVCLVLGAGTVYLIVRTITLPITNLTNMAKKVHEGDLSARTQVTSRDEIGDLGKYFNKMAEGLITTNISLEQKVQERTEKLMEEVKMRKCTEEELQKRTRELETVLDAIPAYVWIGMDPMCRVITGNRVANELFGVAPGTNVSQSVVAVGQAPYIKVLKEDGSEYRPDELPMQRSIALRQSVRDVVLAFRLPDGRQVKALGNAVPLLDVQGNPRGSVAAFVDITEHKRLETRLKASDDSLNGLQRILESMGDGLVVTDTKGEFIYMNPAAKKILGKELHDVSAYRWSEQYQFYLSDMVTPYTSDELPLSRAIRGELVNSAEVYVKYVKMSACKWVSVTAGPLRDKKGDLKGGIAVFRDITEQKNMENRIKELTRKYELILNSTREGIYGLDLEGRTTFVNPSAAKMLGWQAEELIGKNMHAVLHHSKEDGASYPVEDCPIYAAFREGAIYNIDNEVFWRKDGTCFPVYYTSTPILEHDKITGAVVTFNDITERRKREMEYGTIISTTRDGFWTSDIKGRIVDVNNAYCRMTGYSRSELLSMNIGDFEVLEKQEEIIQHIRKVVEKGYDLFESKHRCKDGRIIDVEVSVNFVNYAKGRLFSFIRDITERKELERRLEITVQKLQKTLNRTIETISLMGEMRDPYTAGHEKHVTQLACAIAKEMGLSEDQIEGIRVSAFLHDIGKIVVPSETLSKPAKLNGYEMGMMKTHALAGFDIVKSIAFPWPVSQAILQHHERLDGSGYPKGLKGEEIILEARILAVADVVEAMMNHRPYRPALGIEKAMEEITQGRGVIYDDRVVDACVRLFTEKGFKFE